MTWSTYRAPSEDVVSRAHRHRSHAHQEDSGGHRHPEGRPLPGFLCYTTVHKDYYAPSIPQSEYNHPRLLGLLDQVHFAHLAESSMKVIWMSSLK